MALRRQQTQEENEARDLSKQFNVEQVVRELQEKRGLTYMAALQLVTANQHQRKQKFLAEGQEMENDLTVGLTGRKTLSATEEAAGGSRSCQEREAEDTDEELDVGQTILIQPNFAQEHGQNHLDQSAPLTRADNIGVRVGAAPKSTTTKESGSTGGGEYQSNQHLGQYLNSV